MFMLQEIAKKIQLNLANMSLFSSTRMANYKRIVLKNADKNLLPIIMFLEEIQAQLCNGSSKEREEADKAARLRTKIFTKKFVLRLTGRVI